MSDFQNPLQDERMNILAFDPSKNYTGWLLYKPHEIIKYGCIRDADLVPEPNKKKVMDKYAEFQIGFTEELIKIMRFLDPEHTHVVIEQPTGSQSVKAAWAIAMASSVVVSTSIAMFRKKPILYTERAAKMYMFETATVPKQRTMKAMWSYWRAQNVEPPEKHWERETKGQLRQCMEAVADAMLILNLHLHEISDNGLHI